jgi:hypothetical protein
VVAQDGLIDKRLGPELFEQLLSGDRTVAVLDEIGQHIEHLGLDLEHCPGTAELIELGVEFVVPEGVKHRLFLLGHERVALMVAPIIANSPVRCSSCMKS